MRRAALVTVVVLTALSSCTSDDVEPPAADPTPTVTPTPTPVVAAPPPAAPEVGACYRLSYDEALAPTSDDAAVPCSKAHTTQTFAVGQLDLVTSGHLLAVDSTAVRQQVAQLCPAQLPAYLGGTDEQLRLSMLRPVWFTPTLEQSDAGAAWYRCDVIAVTGDQQVAKIDHGVAGALKGPSEEFAMCGTAQPGTASFSRLPCGEDHSWKAIEVVELAGKSKDGSYPGEGAVKDAGQDVCAAAARAIASDALDYEWGYEWPTQEQWQAGQTYGRCWSPDPA